MSFYRHDTACVDEGARIGEGTKIWHFCHVMPGAVIGERCNLGQNVVVMPGTRIGDNVKIQNNVSIYDEVILDYLEAQRGQAHLVLRATKDQDFVYGEAVGIKVTAVDSHANQAQEGVEISVLFKSTAEPRRLLLAEGATDDAGAFVAEGFSRSSDQVGVINVVPGAGVAYSLAGIAEAWMDNVPMVVIASGIRTDTGRAYQLHAIDQLEILRPVTKAVFRASHVDEIYPMVRRAFAAARSGCPGPAAV